MSLNHLLGKPSPFQAVIDWTHPLSRGIIGFWLLHEGAGNITRDIAKGRNHGIITTAAWVGKGLSFDGAADYITIPSAPIIRPANFTAICWYKPDASTSDSFATIFGQPYDTQGSWNFPFLSWTIGRDGTNNEFAYRVTTGSSTTTPFSGSIDGWSTPEWRMVSLVYDGERATGYIDAVQDNSVTSPSGDIDYADFPNLMIGQQSNDAPGAYFGGEISHCILYDRPLSAREIQMHYARPFRMLKKDRVVFGAAVVGGGLSIPLIMGQHDHYSGGLAGGLRG